MKSKTYGLAALLGRPLKGYSGKVLVTTPEDGSPEWMSQSAVVTIREGSSTVIFGARRGLCPNSAILCWAREERTPRVWGMARAQSVVGLSFLEVAVEAATAAFEMTPRHKSPKR